MLTFSTEIIYLGDGRRLNTGFGIPSAEWCGSAGVRTCSRSASSAQRWKLLVIRGHGGGGGGGGHGLGRDVDVVHVGGEAVDGL